MPANSKWDLIRALKGEVFILPSSYNTDLSAIMAQRAVC